MSMEMRIEGQHLLVVRINGILHRSELDESQRAATKIILKVGTVAVLILLDEFEGWQQGDEWGDVSFLAEQGSHIEKVAIVGVQRWRDEVLMFAGAGLRESPVCYFNDADSARAWLTDPVASQRG